MHPEKERIIRQSGREEDHRSKAVRLQSYVGWKDADCREYLKVRPTDHDKLVLISANNPDEFPWSDDACLQRTSTATAIDLNSPMENRHHRASYLTTLEQSVTRARLDKHREYQKLLKQAVKDGVREPSILGLIRQDEEMVAASIALWKKNFPEKRTLLGKWCDSAGAAIDSFFTGQKRKLEDDDTVNKRQKC